MRVVITEKPSVAHDLAAALGAQARGKGWLEGPGLRITWCLGHLLELAEPDEYDPAWKKWDFLVLPVLPRAFRVRPRGGDSDAVERLRVIRDLVASSNTTEVINACDAGREGELIFRWVMEWCGVERPVRRLWLASMTEGAIQQAWRSMRPGSAYDPLAAAARCRAEADWLVGMNGTRAMTCLARRSGGGRLLSIGRVQTPTLAMIVERDARIAAFVPEPTWQVKARFQATTGEGSAVWTGTWFATAAARGEAEKKKNDDIPDAEKEAPPAERLPSREVADALVAAVVGRVGRVETADTRRETARPPELYDLTTLQQRANRRYGLTAGKTLEIAQALYEKKLITYPRTDSRHLTPDQVEDLPGLADKVGVVPQYRPHADVVIARFASGWRPDRRVVDASEVRDHHAILPTDRSPTSLGLSPDEKRIYDLVVRRFLAALSPDALFDRTTLIVAVDGVSVPGLEDPARFRARARVTVAPGWRAVDPPGPSKDLELPALRPGQPAEVPAAEVVDGATRPPRPFDDASLLAAMESPGKEMDDAELRRILRRAGLGTPATRAATLQTLVDRSYVERRGKELRATALGSSLIQALPTDELKSAQLTGEWERRLAEVAEGERSREAFMQAVSEHVVSLVDRFREADLPANPAFVDDRDAGKPVGACPRCQKPVVERGPVFACSACDFVIYKTVAGREVSRRAATMLLTRGRTDTMKGFKSKRTGKAFSAGLRVNAEGKVELFFPEGEALGGCPTCGAGRVIDKGKVWACDQEGCPMVIFKEVARRPLTVDEARALLTAGRLGPLEGFVSREGKPFRAGLFLSEGRVRLDFGDGRAEAPARGEPPSPDPPAVPPFPPPLPPSEALAGTICPACGQGRLMRGRTGWGCSRWREGCSYVVLPAY